jgi:hypothetical protein
MITLAALINPSVGRTSASRYFLVASRTAFGGANPFSCHSDAALDGPGENAGPFFLEAIAESRVTLIRRDCHREWDQVEATPYRFVDRAERWALWLPAMSSLNCGNPRPAAPFALPIMRGTGV